MLTLAPPPARAQDKNTKPAQLESGEFQTVELDGKSVPPISVTATVADGKTQCDPQTLQVPAETPIDLRIDNQSAQPLSLSSGELFAPGRLVRFDGAVGHAASELGFTVKPHAKGRIVIRTPKAGEYDYGCAAAGNQGTPFKGKLVTLPSAN